MPTRSKLPKSDITKHNHIDSKKPVVALIGRPNVGKSTLFNRLVGRKLAIVHDRPGVTRDRRMAEGRLQDLNFDIIDTAGLEEEAGEDLIGRMQAQTWRAIEDAEILAFMFDGRAGLTAADHVFASALRRVTKPIVLIANKQERASDLGWAEGLELGLGDPIALSAEHGLGMSDLRDGLAAAFEKNNERIATHGLKQGLKQGPNSESDILVDSTESRDQICVAVVGRPNSGKSTLVNAIIGEERVLAGPEAGLTRDAIAVDWMHRGQPLRLVDTAGLRRRAKMSGSPVEKLAAADGLRALDYAHVGIVLLPADGLLERQDFNIASRVIEEGRALVLAINKSDLVSAPAKLRDTLRMEMKSSLAQARHVPLVSISAKDGAGLSELLDSAVQVYQIWNRKLPTPKLNAWLDEARTQHAPPMSGGRSVKLRYIRQIKSRPPTFCIWANRPESIPDHYKRYLVSDLQKAFGLEACPIRIQFKRGKNPYVQS